MSEKRPNIIFILTDQQSANMMSCVGNKYVKTPAMDSLAKNGMTFNRAYCTNPVCLPSRFSLMTGRFPSEINVRDNYLRGILPISDEIKDNTLGFLLRNAGYETAYGGKVHLPNGMAPENLGFEKISVDERDKLADDCVDFIKRSHDKPYFLYASFINPHDICYMAIRAHADSDHERGLLARGKVELDTLDKAMALPEGVSEEEFYKNICPPLPPNYNVQEDEPEAIKMIREQRNFKKGAHEKWGEKDWRMHRWAYCKLTEMVDAQIAKLLAAVKECGQEEETVIIFTSDHGDLDSAHRMEHKTALYEEPCKVPFLISHKGTVPSGVVDDSHLISNGLDLLPTLCDYAGVEVPAGMKGASFRDIAEGREPEEWRKELLVESEFGNMAVADRHKYAVYFEGKSNEQLYDLETDPFETRNFLNDGDKVPVVQKLRDSLQELLS
jgi:choline-sulfatase